MRSGLRRRYDTPMRVLTAVFVVALAPTMGAAQTITPELRVDLMVRAVDTIHSGLLGGDLSNEPTDRALHPALIEIQPGSIRSFGDAMVPDDVVQRLSASRMDFDSVTVCGDAPGSCRMPEIPAVFGVSDVFERPDGRLAVRVAARYRTNSDFVPVATRVMDVVWVLEDGSATIESLELLMIT